jgi:hypothetical protein
LKPFGFVSISLEEIETLIVPQVLQLSAMKPSSKDFLSSLLRRVEPAFPLDITSLIYNFLPMYKFVDCIIDEEFENFKYHKVSLEWLSETMLKNYPEKILNIVHEYFPENWELFLRPYTFENAVSKTFIEKLDKISPIPWGKLYVEVFREKYFQTFLETKFNKKLEYTSRFNHSVYKLMNHIGSNPDKNTIFVKKYRGQGSYGYYPPYTIQAVTYDFFPGEKTLPEAVEYMFLKYSV